MTSHFTRRTLLATLSVSALAGLPGLTGPAWAQPGDGLQEWLAANARPIRSVDPADEDFSDLEPLAAAIGEARVVQLGEPSHNAGTCFAAKARLIKFLHQRLGFSVVVWESGLYDVDLAEAGLRADEDPSAAAQRGILRNWSASEHCRPLFAYAQQSHATSLPLVMAGFDSTLTSPFSNLAAELRAHAVASRRRALRREMAAATDELIAAFATLTRYVEARNALEIELTAVIGDARREAVEQWERDTGAAFRPDHAAFERFVVAQRALAELLRANEATFADAVGLRRSGFMHRVVESLSARGTNLYERFGTDVVASTDGGLAEQNRRDASNAANLRWLIEQGYPGQKIIVWAHNAHVMNAYYEAPGWKIVRLDAGPNTMKPHGVYVADWLGRDLYTIGFTAYEGEDGWTGLYASPIPAAREGSLEERLHRLDRPYAFLDLRTAAPLRSAQVMRVPKYDENEIADPARPYDGLFFIARMERATLVPT